MDIWLYARDSYCCKIAVNLLGIECTRIVFYWHILLVFILLLSSLHTIRSDLYLAFILTCSVFSFYFYFMLAGETHNKAKIQMSANCRMCAWAVSKCATCVCKLLVFTLCAYVYCTVYTCYLLLALFICMNFDEKRYVWQNISFFFIYRALDVICWKSDSFIYKYICTFYTRMLIRIEMYVSSRICTILYCIEFSISIGIAQWDGRRQQ